MTCLIQPLLGVVCLFSAREGHMLVFEKPVPMLGFRIFDFELF